MGSGLRFFVVSVFLFSLLAFSVSLVGATNGDDVPLEVAEAEEALVLAYDSVLEAEEAGANVSTMLGMLNVGEDYLAEAYVHLRVGDSEGAVHLAGFCVQVVDDVNGEAVLLREEAARSERSAVLVRVFGSAVGVVIVVVSAFLLWGFFKRRYYNKVLKMRPEVSDSEA